MIKQYSLSVDTIELILTHSREFVYYISVHQMYVYMWREKFSWDGIWKENILGTKSDN